MSISWSGFFTHIALGTSVVLAVIGGFPVSAGASTPAGNVCNPEISGVNFSAAFQWSEAGTPRGDYLLQMKDRSAQILQGNRCVAFCTVQTRAKNKGAKNAPGSGLSGRKLAETQFPEAVDLECRATDLSGMVTPASLIFRTEQGAGKTPILRFGSWVNGYQETELKVQVDQLS